MRIDVVSLFPEFIAQCAGFGMTGQRTTARIAEPLARMQQVRIVTADGARLVTSAGGTAVVLLTMKMDGPWILPTMIVYMVFHVGFGQPLTMSWLALLVPQTLRGDRLQQIVDGADRERA